MDDSILTSIKYLLGIAKDYTNFDATITMHINSVFTILSQLGIGPETPFFITDASQTWTEFIDSKNVELVRSYMSLQVKMLFDPPSSSSVIQAYDRMISQFEWRLAVLADAMKQKPDTPEEYQGEYEVTPKVYDQQILETANKLLTDNVTVHKVPYSETSNKAEGTTVYIGDEVETHI